MNPDFSIIVPVFNVARYIRACLDSIVNQTMESSWEVVCIDDGSTDESGSILDEYAMKDPRVRVFHTANRGVVEARKVGFEHSHGDWIWFVDGDDCIDEYSIEVLSRCIEDKHLELLHFKASRVRDEDGKGYPSRELQIYPIRELIKQVRNTPLEIIGMCIGDKIYKRNVVWKTLNRVGEIRIKHSEDGLFAFTAFVNSDCYASIPVTLYYYIDRPNSAVHRPNVKIIHEKILYIDAIDSVFRESKYFSPILLSRIVSFHSYEAINYTIMALLRWDISLKELLTVARRMACSGLQLRASSLFRIRKRRRIMLFLSYHPLVLLVVRVLFRYSRKGLRGK